MKSKRKKDLKTWWKDRIECLSVIEINGIKVSADNIYSAITKSNSHCNFYEKGVWTSKKLAILQYYFDIYTKIQCNRLNKLFYFDLFSGSGLIKLKNINKFIFGSSLLSILVPLKFSKHLFNKYYFVEIDKERADMLKRSIEEIKNQVSINIEYEILVDDMNNINYEKYMKESEHSLVVIDPEGIEPKWETVSKILDNKCDVIFTFMTSGIQRLLGKKDEKATNVIKEFIGENTVPDDIDAQKLMKLYIKKIKSKGKDATIDIPIEAKRFKYNIIVAARKTSGGNPWLKPIDEIKPKLKVRDTDLEDIFKVTFGIQGELPLED
ncbi:MAG: three-Cys-motif partner protein TcmP [Thermoproteota archaeon]|jgi:three-Cys-motif partner protein